MGGWIEAKLLTHKYHRRNNTIIQQQDTPQRDETEYQSIEASIKNSLIEFGDGGAQATGRTPTPTQTTGRGTGQDNRSVLGMNHATHLHLHLHPRLHFTKKQQFVRSPSTTTLYHNNITHRNGMKRNTNQTYPSDSLIEFGDEGAQGNGRTPTPTTGLNGTGQDIRLVLGMNHATHLHLHPHPRLYSTNEQPFVTFPSTGVHYRYRKGDRLLLV